MITKLTRLSIIAFALMCGLSLTAFAQDFVKTYPLGPDGSISITNISGNVKVTGTDGGGVVVMGFKEGRDREMEPYYTIMRVPGESKEEFVLLTLFNPARRDNMIAWLAARSDVPNYGRLIVFNFPKQKLVYGPRQIDARIDQDPIISQQLALWNQRGSQVIRGSLLAIPIDQSLIYVQPLYLAASEQGALPELRRVIVAYGNQIAMEATLEQSLARIFTGMRPAGAEAAAPARTSTTSAPASDAVRSIGQRAWEIWQRSQDALRRGDWAAYGAEQKRLEDVLRSLTEGGAAKP